jgi:glutamate synthase domain-containing protein 3
VVNAPTTIEAGSRHYSDLNRELREAVLGGERHIEIRNVFGQRYIGTNLGEPVRLDIYGTPGNDLGAFMDGPTINVHGNAQDGLGNTMNEGEIIVHGRAGDITGLSARGGKMFIRDTAGYRVGIHMKEYKDKRPSLVVGETAQDFLGEYMAGGVLVVLGLNLNLEEGQIHTASFIGTGMHGGVIYLRGGFEQHQLGREVGVADLDDDDRATLEGLVGEYCRHFDRDESDILGGEFKKLFPLYLRPYGRLYS